jgi:hypothetical protein
LIFLPAARNEYALSSNSRNLRQDVGPGIGHWHLHMMVFTPYYENSMLDDNEFAGALPFVSDDAGTPFTVTVISVDHVLAQSAAR